MTFKFLCSKTDDESPRSITINPPPSETHVQKKFLPSHELLLGKLMDISDHAYDLLAPFRESITTQKPQNTEAIGIAGTGTFTSHRYIWETFPTSNDGRRIDCELVLLISTDMYNMCLITDILLFIDDERVQIPDLPELPLYV